MIFIDKFVFSQKIFIFLQKTMKLLICENEGNDDFYHKNDDFLRFRNSKWREPGGIMLNTAYLRETLKNALFLNLYRFLIDDLSVQDKIVESLSQWHCEAICHFFCAKKIQFTWKLSRFNKLIPIRRPFLVRYEGCYWFVWRFDEKSVFLHVFRKNMIFAVMANGRKILLFWKIFRKTYF